MKEGGYAEGIIEATEGDKVSFDFVKITNAEKHFINVGQTMISLLSDKVEPVDMAWHSHQHSHHITGGGEGRWREENIEEGSSPAGG